MAYDERLRCCLTSMALGFTGEIPGLTREERDEAVADLVKGDIVVKIGVVWDPAGLPSLSYPLGPRAWLSKAQQSCVPATALFLQTSYRLESLPRLFFFDWSSDSSRSHVSTSVFR